MTCHDARDQLSAVLDDALDAVERQALDAHLATCPDCRRELEQLRTTVARLAQLPAARAPAGFVDHVMARAYRPPWPRRLLAALFVPLRVKLPLEAAAVLLVGVSALYVYQHAPEVQQVARQEAREAAPAPTPAPAAPPSEPVATPPAPPLSPRIAPGPARSEDRARAVERVPAEPEAASEAKRQVPQTPSAPATRPDDVRDVVTAKREARVQQRADAPGEATSPTGSERAAPPAEPSAARDAAAAGARAAPSVETSPPVAAPEALGGVAGTATAPAAPPSPSAVPGPALPTAKSRGAGRLMRAVDASGRLTVPARGPAERALDALLARLGAARVGPLLEGDRGMVVIDVLVPGTRYRELIEGLGQIGRWVTDVEPRTIPTQVRVEVALTVEP